MATFSSQDFIFLGLLFMIGYVINFYLNYFRRSNKLPGPLPLPIIGNLHQYTNDISVWGKWLQSNYGDIGEVWFGGERAIWLGKADYLEKIFKPSAGNYNYRAAPNEGLDILDMTSKGIGFNRDLNKWNINRRNFTRAIATPSFMRQSVKSIQSLFLEMEEYWKDLNQRNIEIDLVNWGLRLFVDIIFLITTNKKCDALKNHYKVLYSPEENAVDTEILVGHVNSIFEGLEFFLMTPKFLYVLPNYNKRAKKLLISFDWVRKYYLQNIIKERREEIEKTPADQELTHDMLTIMITLNTPRDMSQGDKSLEPMSDEDICGNIFEAVVGGIDTSSNASCYVVYYLCQYPKVKQRVFEEIQKVFGLNPNINISYEELNKLHYCEAVIKEVSRIQPLTPFTTRMAENADEINGHKFRGSTQIFINIQETHMNKSHWEEPEKFNPERFLSLDNDKIKKNSFLTFGGGTRKCPGRNLVMVELKIFLVLLFGKYDVELVDPSAPLKTHCTLVNHCDELKIRLIPRN